MEVVQDNPENEHEVSFRPWGRGREMGPLPVFSGWALASSPKPAFFVLRASGSPHMQVTARCSQPPTPFILGPGALLSAPLASSRLHPGG